MSQVAGPPPERCVACSGFAEVVVDGARLCRSCAELYPEVMTLGPSLAAELKPDAR